MSTHWKNFNQWKYLGAITKAEGELPEKHLQRTETCNGQLGWLGNNGKPDVAAGHSITASNKKEKKSSLITDCNTCVKQAQSHKYRIKVWPIRPADLRMATFCDSAYDPLNIRHQQGWIVCVTNYYFNRGEKAPISIIMWKSR